MNSKLVQDALPFCITDGNPARARGLNLVGLRRAGFKADEIAQLKEAYRLLYRKVPLAEAVAQMKASSSKAVRELGDFLLQGKRGFAHPGD
jgi:UDP-N-acetylglucosamine acyltransferase